MTDPHFAGLALWREPSRLRRLLRAIKDHLEGIGADLNRTDKP